MSNLKQIDPKDPEQRELLIKIIERFWELPEHYQVVLKAFLEKALDGDKDANQISDDYNAGEMTTVELWEKLQRRYVRTELLA